MTTPAVDPWSGFQHRLSVDRIRRALEFRLVRASDHWLWDIVGPTRTGLRQYGTVPPTGLRQVEVPFGWVQVRDFDRHTWRLLPCWIAWPYLAWRYRWWVLDLLHRAGVVKIKEADYWHNARPWFWTDEREASFRAMLRGLPN